MREEGLTFAPPAFWSKGTARKMNHSTPGRSTLLIIGKRKSANKIPDGAGESILLRIKKFAEFGFSVVNIGRRQQISRGGRMSKAGRRSWAYTFLQK